MQDFFVRNNLIEKVEEFKNQYRKYRKICDLDKEVKLYLYSKFRKTNKLFVINAERKIGKMLKHSGLEIVLPFLNKELKSMNECPDYAKLPPSGYCQKGAINLMFGVDDTYNCDCNKEESEIVKIVKKLWRRFDENIRFDEKEQENYKKSENKYSIVDKSENSKKKKLLYYLVHQA